MNNGGERQVAPEKLKALLARGPDSVQTERRALAGKAIAAQIEKCLLDIYGVEASVSARSAETAPSAMVVAIVRRFDEPYGSISLALDGDATCLLIEAACGAPWGADPVGDRHLSGYCGPKVVGAILADAIGAVQAEAIRNADRPFGVVGDSLGVGTVPDASMAKCLSIGFALAIGARRACMRVDVSSQAFLDRLGQRGPEEKPDRQLDARAWRRAMSRQIELSPVTIDAVIAEHGVVLGAIQRLKVGSVLPLKASPKSQVDLCVRGVAVFRCALGQDDGHFTLRVLSTHANYGQ